MTPAPPAPRAWWRVKPQTDSTLVEFGGEFDENTDFAALKEQLRGTVEFRLADIKRINSCGVREWVNLVHDLPQVTDLILTYCAPVIVNQLNAIYNFRGPARVKSLLAPYVCEACSIEEFKLIEVGSYTAGRILLAPVFNCAKCGGAMDFDDLPERYLSFLKE